jgi:hypothetical protein
MRWESDMGSPHGNRRAGTAALRHRPGGGGGRFNRAVAARSSQHPLPGAAATLALVLLSLALSTLTGLALFGWLRI